MRIKNLLIGMLAAVVAVSCSKKDEPDNQPKGEKTWVALSIGSAKTYAEDDGTAQEQKINRVDIFLFTPNNDPMESEYESHQSFTNLTSSKTPAFETNTAQKKMVVLVNAQADYINTLTSDLSSLKLKDLISSTAKISATNEDDFTSKYANTTGDGSFMMINENPDQTITFALQPDRSSAQNASRPVVVERLVAKVVVKYDNISNLSSLKSSVQEVKFILDVKNKSSLLYNSIGQDVNYDSYTSNDFFTFEGSNFDGVSAVNVTLDKQESTPLYCFENTIKQDYQAATKVYALEDATTNLIFRVRFGTQTFWLSRLDGTTTTDDKTGDLNYVKYTDGYSYYRVFIKTDGLILGSTTDYAYGVKRNNKYEVTINKIEQVGAPSIQTLLNQPIATNKLIGVDISVKKWTVVASVVNW